MTDMIEYAKALFSLTEEDSSSDRVMEEMTLVDKILSENPRYISLLDTPALSKDERTRLIDEAFSSLDKMLLNTLKLLSERRSIHEYPALVRSYAKLYDEARGIEKVEVISAIALNDEQRERLKARLEKETGKTVILKCTVDSAILGGIKLRYSGIQRDASLKTRLDGISESIKRIVIR